MTEWTCRQCRGLGMYRDEERDKYVLCDCPAGDSKRRWLKKTPEERRHERKPDKKKRRDDEPVPSWVYE